MELRSLQYFVQIADEGSITRTAEKLGIAQPALTRHVKQLESELGALLLLRLPRGVRLTSSGRDFLEHARRVVAEVARAKAQVQGQGQAPQGEVIMGTSPTMAPLLLPGCVARARQFCPKVRLKVIEGFSHQLLDALITGRLDVAVMSNPPRSPALALTPLLSEPLFVLGAPGARGSTRPFSLAELSRAAFLASEGMRAIIDEQLARFGSSMRVEGQIDSIESIRRLLVAGQGMSIMPVSAFHAEIARGELQAYGIEGANLHRILVLARPVGAVPAPAADEIERVVRAEMSRLQDSGLFQLPASMRPGGSEASSPRKPRGTAARAPRPGANPRSRRVGRL
jgi:LysR family nitrogen assimilation transcriptional regulator